MNKTGEFPSLSISDSCAASIVGCEERGPPLGVVRRKSFLGGFRGDSGGGAGMSVPSVREKSMGFTVKRKDFWSGCTPLIVALYGGDIAMVPDVRLRSGSPVERDVETAVGSFLYLSTLSMQGVPGRRELVQIRMQERISSKR